MSPNAIVAAQQRRSGRTVRVTERFVSFTAGGSFSSSSSNDDAENVNNKRKAPDSSSTKTTGKLNIVD